MAQDAYEEEYEDDEEEYSGSRALALHSDQMVNRYHMPPEMARIIAYVCRVTSYIIIGGSTAASDWGFISFFSMFNFVVVAHTKAGKPVMDHPGWFLWVMGIIGLGVAIAAYLYIFANIFSATSGYHETIQQVNRSRDLHGHWYERTPLGFTFFLLNNIDKYAVLIAALLYTFITDFLVFFALANVNVLDFNAPGYFGLFIMALLMAFIIDWAGIKFQFISYQMLKYARMEEKREEQSGFVGNTVKVRIISEEPEQLSKDPNPILPKQRSTKSQPRQQQKRQVEEEKEVDTEDLKEPVAAQERTTTGRTHKATDMPDWSTIKR